MPRLARLAASVVAAKRGVNLRPGEAQRTEFSRAERSQSPVVAAAVGGVVVVDGDDDGGGLSEMQP